MKQVGIVGLGLMGGSLALALRRSGFSVRGVDADREQVRLARKAGIDADESTRAFLSAVPSVIVICTPISAVGAVHRELRQLLPGNPHYFHAGGLQTPEHLSLSPSDAAALIGTHPLAGSHESGFRSARDDLYQNCVVFVEQKASAAQLQAAVELWTAAGAGRIVVEEAQSHDARVSVVSHLPQLAATALALTIHQRGYRQSDLGSGGRDATRIAGSPFGFWQELLQRSGDEAVSHLTRLQFNIGCIRDAIAQGNWQEVERLWSEARSLHSGDAPAANDIHD